MTSTKSTNQLLILQAMIAIASADGVIDGDEVTNIRNLYAQENGEEASVHDIAKAAHMLEANGGSILKTLSDACATMDETTKESLLRASYLVLLADGQVASQERKKLYAFASTLKIPQIHLSVILEDVSD